MLTAFFIANCPKIKIFQKKFGKNFFIRKKLRNFAIRKLKHKKYSKTNKDMAKEITIVKYHNGHATEYIGTIEHLRTKVFGYTLDCGNSWNHKIPVAPRTAKSLVKALNDSAYECRKYSDRYELG